MRTALGKRIRELRKARGLSQGDLSKLVGLTCGMVSHIELGRKTPTLHTLVRIARALSVPVGELVQVFEKEKDGLDRASPPSIKEAYSNEDNTTEQRKCQNGEG